ncbi:Tn3 family transposase [Spirosoma sp.]|uniref:Tn3 family transposase n=1 Tax=Spirosoma sp. TaxID=1899569 RepID=UPI0026167EA5|nr:Tn3 family transposase [Spirosoma sp.]MCX6215811.1 Tn3 family transposase [Spirosoma sp.]
MIGSIPSIGPLRDPGRLYKTEYILGYIDDPLLRETVEGILTRVEHANRFAKAVVLGNNGQFGWAIYHE